MLFPKQDTIYIMICKRCNIEKPEEEFPPNGNKRKSSYCKICKREYDKEFYARTIEKRKERKKVNSKVIRDRNNKYIREYLENNCCVDCGEKDPIVLEFDHKHDKKYNVSDMTTLSIEYLQKEIDKCEIRCANCHRRKTAKQFGWYNRV